MLKGQLSGVPWSGNSWRSFTFHHVLQALQHTHSS